jgi:hypothetical protein
MKAPGLVALLLLLCGCSGYEVRCAGPLRPINASAPAAASRAAATGAAAADRSDVSGGAMP